jgi:hypothetical protein
LVFLDMPIPLHVKQRTTLSEGLQVLSESTAAENLQSLAPGWYRAAQQVMTTTG